MASSEDAAATAAAALLSAEASADEAASGSEETEDEITFPEFNIELPADLAALLEEDDTELDVTDEEIESLVEENEDVPREMLQRMLKAEKKAAHLEKLRVNEAKKNWGEEAEKFFPFSQPFLDQIEATSKRGFLRTAKQIHDRMAPLVDEKVLKPAREAIAAEKLKTKDEAKAEVRDAWGQPIIDNEDKPVPRVVEQQQNRRRRGELSDVIRGMIFNKEE